MPPAYDIDDPVKRAGKNLVGKYLNAPLPVSESSTCLGKHNDCGLLSFLAYTLSVCHHFKNMQFT